MRPGKVRIRGTIRFEAALASGRLPTGAYFLGSNSAVIGQTAAVVSGKTFAPWEYPDDPAAADISPAGALWFRSPGGTMTQITYGDVREVPGPQTASLDGSVYGISWGYSTTSPTTLGGSIVAPDTTLYLAAADSPSSYTAPTFCAGAPTGALDLAVYQNRIWVLGGKDVAGGGTTNSPTMLYFTNPIAGGGGVSSSDWKDPVSGLSNKISLGGDGYDTGVALAVCGRSGLLIFRRRSVWLLRGTTSANYTLIPISREVGAVDPRAVVETDRGVYFLSHRGLMFTNGAQIVDVSGQCTNTLRYAIQTTLMNLRNNGGSLCCCTLNSGGEILITVGLHARTQQQPIWSGLYDPTTKTWTRITSPALAEDNSTANSMGYPSYCLRSHLDGWTINLGQQNVVSLEGNNRGMFVTPDLDFLDGLYDQLSASWYAIPARWLTRIPPLVATTTLTRKFSQVKRCFIDHFISGPPPGTANGWRVQVLEATDPPAPIASFHTYVGEIGSGNFAAQSIQWQGWETASPVIMRQNLDLPNEVSDVQFDIRWSDNNSYGSAPYNNAFGELYGVGIEYQPTRDLR